jgi:hypothetical protein
MSTSNDQQFTLQATGTSDWDTALNANFSTLERGFHFVERVGAAVNTGDICRISSGGFMFPASCDVADRGLVGLALVSAASGDSVRFLQHGIVRSLSVFSSGDPGERLFVSALTPGMVARSYSAAYLTAGRRLSGAGFLFEPQPFLPENLTKVTTVAGILNTDVDFTLDTGKRGWVRQVIMTGSADLVTLSFFSNSARTARLYETYSGGVTSVGSFLDQAGLPYENTDASTLSGLVYGRLRIMTGANVTSGDIGVTLYVDRMY